MKRTKLLLLLAVAMLLASCKPCPTDVIAKLEKQAFAKEGAVEPEIAEQLVDAYCNFATKNPSNDAAADYLFKAVEVSMNFDNPQKTIAIIDRMMKEYPENKQTSKALFLKGFIYETRFGNYGLANEAYELYLELYPDGELATDCKASIENLGLTPEEMVRKFEEMREER